MILPQELSPPKQLKSLMQSLATLDAILSPEWEYRYYSFDSKWGEGEEMGSIRNGSGDTVFILFNSAGCFIKGFSHEYPIDGKSSDDFYSGVPQEFLDASQEPAFSPNSVSFCCWRKYTDQNWHSTIPDIALDQNSFFLIQDLDGNENSYQKYSTDYHEMVSDIGDIAFIYKHKPMTKDLASALNKDVEYAKLIVDLNTIGYPVNNSPQSPPSDRLVERKGFFKKLFGG